MAIPIANVNQTTDTFLDWLDKTNQVLDNLSTKIITTEANTTGGVTSGNAVVNGTFSANVFSVVTGIRGGSVASPGVLNITSNAAFVNTSANVFVLTTNTTTSAIVSNVAVVNINSTNTNFNTGVLTISANVNTTSNLVTLNNNVTNIAGNSFVVTSTNTLINSSLVVNSALAIVNTANLTVQGGSATFAGNTLFSGVATYSDAIVVTGNGTYSGISNYNNLTNFNANVVFGSGITTFNSNVAFAAANVSLNNNITTISGNGLTISTNSVFNSNLTVNTSLAIINTANLAVQGGNISFTSNTSFSGSDTSFSGSNTSFSANVIFVNTGITTFNSNVAFAAANVTLNNNLTTISGNGLTISTNSVFNSNLTVNTSLAIVNTANLTVQGGNTTFTANTIFTGNTFFNGGFVVNTVAEFNSGNTEFANNTLFIDNTNERIAIGTDNTSNNLNRLIIAGNTLVTANLYVSDRIEAQIIACNTFIVDSDIAFTGTSNGNFVPSTNAFSLGNTTNRWAVFGSSGLFANDVSAFGNTTLNEFVNIGKNTTIGSVLQRQFAANATSVDTTTEFITISAHGFSNGDMLYYSIGAGNTVIGGLTDKESYFVRDANSTAFRLSTTLGGSTANLTSTGSGTGHFFTRNQINLQTQRISLGNTTVNTFITPLTIETDGSLIVLGETALSNTLAAGNTSVTGFINVSSTANVGGVANFRANVVANGQLIVANTVSFGNSTVSGFANVTSVVTVGTARTTQSFNALSNVNSGTETITITGHGFVNNDVVTYLVAAGNTAISGLANGTNYFIVEANTTTFKLSSSQNGSPLNITSGLNETGHSFVTTSTSLTPNRISLGNSTVNTFITPIGIETDGTLVVTGTSAFTGDVSIVNTNVTGLANVSTLNVSTVTINQTLATGNTTITGFINVSSTANVGGVANFRANVVANGQLIVANTAEFGNTSITGFINVSSTANVGGVANFRANVVANGQLLVVNTVSFGNSTVSGFANVTSVVTVGTARTTQSFNASSNVNSLTETITITGHGFVNNDVVTYLVAAGNTAIGGLSNGVSYFVINADSNSFRLASSLSGTQLNLTAGSNETGHSFITTTTSLTPQSLYVGNSTVNTFVTPFTIETDGTLVVSGNSSLNLVSAGNTTITGFANVSQTIFGGTSLTIGTDSFVVANTSAIRVGNSTVNNIITHNQVKVGNNTVNSDLNAGVLNIGSNVSLNVSSLKVGNSTVNVVLTATALTIGNTSVNTTITANGISGGSVSLTELALTEINIANTINLGDNNDANTISLLARITNQANTTDISFGNSTVFAYLNSTSFSVSNLSGNGASVTSVNAETVGGNTALTLRQYSDLVASNASNLTAGTIPEARLPAGLVRTTVNILTSNGISGQGNLSANVSLSLTGQALAFHDLNDNGIVVRTAANTVNARSITGANGIAVANGSGVEGNPQITLTGQALSLHNVGTNGFFVRTSNTTVASRTLAAGAGITITNSDGVSGNPTISIGGEAQQVQTRALYVGTGTASYGANGTIHATNDIVAHFSDARLKTVVGTIHDALEKVNKLSGYYYKPNDIAKGLGYLDESIQVGVIAQEIEEVLPEIIREAPVDKQYKTVLYEKITPLLIQAIKELNKKVEDLEERIKRNGSES